MFWKSYYNIYSKLKKIEKVNVFDTNILITGGNHKQRVNYLISIIKKIIKKRPGAAYYRFENMIEHFRENKYFDHLPFTVCFMYYNFS